MDECAVILRNRAPVDLVNYLSIRNSKYSISLGRNEQQKKNTKSGKWNVEREYGWIQTTLSVVMSIYRKDLPHQQNTTQKKKQKKNCWVYCATFVEKSLFGWGGSWCDFNAVKLFARAGGQKGNAALFRSANDLSTVKMWLAIKNKYLTASFRYFHTCNIWLFVVYFLFLAQNTLVAAFAALFFVYVFLLLLKFISFEIYFNWIFNVRSHSSVIYFY